MIEFRHIEDATPLEDMRQVAQFAIDIAERQQRELVSAKRDLSAASAIATTCLEELTRLETRCAELKKGIRVALIHARQGKVRAAADILDELNVEER